MIPVERIEDLEEGSLVLIYLDEEPINGYILEVIEAADGVSTLIVCHDGDFEEEMFDVYWDSSTGAILEPEIYLH